MTVLAPILQRTPVLTIEDVLARMVEIDAALPARDGVACFNKLYLRVTEGVIAAAKDAEFRDSVFLSQLDIAFGNLYFAALRALEDGGGAPPRAWSPLFDRRASDDIAPLQFAFAGMNAHINRDLPEGLRQTFVQLGLELTRSGPAYEDYQRVNPILEKVEADVKADYVSGLYAEIDHDFHGVDDLLAMWSIRTAREAAWTNAEAMWHLRGNPTLVGNYLGMLDRMVGFAGRGLLVPTRL